MHKNLSKNRVLFILKRRSDYGQDPSYSHSGVSTGLLNSAAFMDTMLQDAGIESKIVVVVDNNGIDKEVNEFKPTHVVIEALWVVPTKFDVLSKLHPEVTWIVRFHSEAPFIAGEGIAMQWLLEYVKRPNVQIGINAPRFLEEIQDVLCAAGMKRHEIKQRVHYMPNYYPVDDFVAPKKYDDRDHINVCCFGAIRPLKNHFIQALAALKFACSEGKKLHFHINVGRIEGKGEPILKNLEQLFAGLEAEGHKLVKHQWMPHDEFLEIVKQMDIGMQVSFSETFNIVAADMINNGIPVVMSKEVPWAFTGITDPTDSSDIARSLSATWAFKWLNVALNRLRLLVYVRTAKNVWLELFR